jgi:hypothetical protein
MFRIKKAADFLGIEPFNQLERVHVSRRSSWRIERGDYSYLAPSSTAKKKDGIEPALK